MNQDHIIIDQRDTLALNRFFAKIYGFVAMGIGLSALTAWLSITAFWEVTYSLLVSGSGVLMLLMLVEIGLVFVASSLASKNSPLALPIFLVYSVLNGFTLSFVLLYYTATSVFTAFISAALMFAVMAVIGLTTKKDLSGMGQALYAGLIGVILVGFVNFFLQSSGMSFLLSLVSVVIFSGLIAYDNQRIRTVFDQTGGRVENGWAIALALSLYLDFINLFLNLLRLFGRND